MIGSQPPERISNHRGFCFRLGFRVYFLLPARYMETESRRCRQTVMNMKRICHVLADGARMLECQHTLTKRSAETLQPLATSCEAITSKALTSAE